MTKSVHSPLGASSAERWMACPGSIALIKKLQLPETDEPEYRGLGIAAHELGAYCLLQKCDTWELIGQEFHGFKVDQEMAEAVQVYLDVVRPICPNSLEEKLYVEYKISHPDHEHFYGTLDSALILEDTIEINDYKHGQGIAVDVEENPQLMYYAYGFLREHAEIKTVILRIIQPRLTWHLQVKEWATTSEHINKWVEEILLPAMRIAEMENGDLDAGNHCRFCPAKLICPMLTGLFKSAANTNPQEIKTLTNDSLGFEYKSIQAVKFYIKALEEEIYRRLNISETIQGTKLVYGKTDRVFKPEAPIKETFGEEAYTKPELKSPAQIDKIGAIAKEFTKEWAYSPQGKLTVVSEDDRRIAVKVQTTQEAFGKVIENLS